jgi:DNA segregation ATPase FtsK/SpoIIIE-like protein
MDRKRYSEKKEAENPFEDMEDLDTPEFSESFENFRDGLRNLAKGVSEIADKFDNLVDDQNEDHGLTQNHFDLQNEIKTEVNSEPNAISEIDQTDTLLDTQIEQLEEISNLFLKACHSYRIDVVSCDPWEAVEGPNVIRFYVKLAAGQKLAPFRNVLEDISREMGRSGLLLNPIPNSDKIALDIPRHERAIVSIKRGLELLPKIDSPEQMPIPIGVTPEGDDIIRDLAEMPHILVGGTTGAGKTVFLYGLISALLKTHQNPNSLRLLISTSKPEDFIFFEGLKHLETGRVIGDAEEALQVLQCHLQDAFLERREILTSARCRDISEYNRNNNDPLSPLVVIIDEFADLADQFGSNKTAKEAFYANFRRVAQLGRSRGIHLVLCTQRPSADLVPTNIRNLMNVRVSFCVNDAKASRMILDEVGAEKLQMKGDLLFKEQAIFRRLQGYFMSTRSLDRLIRLLK